MFWKIGKKAYFRTHTQGLTVWQEGHFYITLLVVYYFCIKDSRLVAAELRKCVGEFALPPGGPVFCAVRSVPRGELHTALEWGNYKKPRGFCTHTPPHTRLALRTERCPSGPKRAAMDGEIQPERLGKGDSFVAVRRWGWPSHQGWEEPELG